MEQGEIKVIGKNLQDAQKKLQDLSSKTAARTCRVNFAESKGDLADQILQTAEKLNNAAKALSALYAQTAATVESARMEFQETDEALAASYGGNTSES